MVARQPEARFRITSYNVCYTKLLRIRAYYGTDAREEAFTEILQDAALECHTEVIRRAEADPDFAGMATTLTLYLGVWPWTYLLQVGDSRYYVYADGKLTQVTRDQTMAEDLVDQGIFTRSRAHGPTDPAWPASG